MPALCEPTPTCIPSASLRVGIVGIVVISYLSRVSALLIFTCVCWCYVCFIIGPYGTGEEDLVASVSLPATSKERKARNRLFSSSESESSDSAVDEERDGTTTQPTRAFSMASSGRSVSAKQHGSGNSSSAPFGRIGANGNGGSSNDLRRKTMTTSSSFKGPSGHASVSRESANNSFIGVGSLFPERKGLFEQDDDTESMEKFHEQVKIRQQKKQSEMETVKAELESTLQRVVDLEQQVNQEVKEKQEYEIRMKECHRIIEKRNKQLMKASERVARYSEQAESQMGDLQAKVTELTAQCEQLRVDASRQRESLQQEAEMKLHSQQEAFEGKLAEQRQIFEARMARMTQISQESLSAKQSDNEALKRSVQELETEVSTAPLRVLQSDEYQTLLKRCEDAEAISRGLKFQLQKDQQEKKFFKNQLSALQISGGNGPSGLFADEKGHLRPSDDQVSPTSSVASGAGDLSSFDYARASMVGSPVHSKSPSKSPSRRHTDFISPTIDTSFESNLKSSATTADEPEIVPLQRTPKPKDEPVAVVATPPPPPTEEKSPVQLPRQNSASTNFFEKLSIKFKRSSSPRNSATNTKTDNSSFSASSVPVAAASASSFTSSSPASLVLDPTTLANAAAATLPVQTATSRRERPKMYVAKASSTYDEESSDSIFGSESDESDENSPSGTEDESPPMPPPPPEETLKPSTTPATALPSAESFLFGPQQAKLPSDDESDDDADLSSSSDSDAQLFAPSKKKSQADELPPPVAIKKPDGVKGDSLSSSSSESDDDSDNEDGSLIEKSKQHDQENVKRKRHRTAAPATEAAEESDDSSDSSSSSSDEELDTNHHRRRRENEDGGDHHHRHHDHHHHDSHHSHHKKESRRSSSLPRTSREKSHSTGDEVGGLASTSKSRMNEYMEARAKKRQEKLKKKEEKENAEHKKKEEYEKEWEKMAQEERERKRKQQQSRRGTRRRPSSLKTVRVSQMKQQLNKQQQQKEHEHQSGRPDGDNGGQPDDERPRRQNPRRKSESKVSDSDDDELSSVKPAVTVTESTPLPPEPTEADTELYLRQQARLRERHEIEMKKKSEADEADLVRGQIHRRVEMWAFGKELLHMILTLDQISTSEALQKCQMSVIQSPDNETVRKAYRYEGFILCCVILKWPYLISNSTLCDYIGTSSASFIQTNCEA